MVLVIPGPFSSTKLEQKKRKEKLRKQRKSSSHQLRKRGHLAKKSPFTRKEKGGQ